MLNSVSGVSGNINVRTNHNIKAQDTNLNTPIVEPGYDTVCFKGVGKLKQISLIAKVTKILFTGGGLIALAKFMENLSKDEAEFVDEYLSSKFNIEEDEEELLTIEQGRKDFNEMNTHYAWIQKYKSNPELFEKLLLEEDEYNGETGKRLYFIDNLYVIRAFYKNEEALNRIFSRDNILDIERFSKDGFHSPIKDLQIDCKDFIDKKMFETDDEGKIMLHVFADEYKSSDKFASPFLHVNQVYEKQPEKLVEMYLTKDSNSKYPLEYLKDKPKEEQESALNTVKEAFRYNTELYEKVLATYDNDYLLKEQELKEKANQVMKNGWEYIDEEGNRIKAKIKDISLAEELITGERDKLPYGYNNFEKYNDKNQLLEESRGDDFSTTSTEYFYNENDVCVKKVRSVSSKYNSSTETFTLVNGQWKSDKEGGWADW